MARVRYHVRVAQKEELAESSNHGIAQRKRDAKVSFAQFPESQRTINQGEQQTAQEQANPEPDVP